MYLKKIMKPNLDHSRIIGRINTTVMSSEWVTASDQQDVDS